MLLFVSLFIKATWFEQNFWETSVATFGAYAANIHIIKARHGHLLLNFDLSFFNLKINKNKFDYSQKPQLAISNFISLKQIYTKSKQKQTN